MNIDAILTLLRPLYLLYLSASFIPHTIYNLLTSRNFTPFLSLSSFKDHWFARFWSWFGPLSSAKWEPAVSPLVAHASGIVLDIGPGQGHLLHLYGQSPNRDKITKIYAVEPNEGHHFALRTNAKRAGLDGIFEIVGSTIETLESEGGIARGSVDTIVTLSVLCSINDPEVLIRELRTYLKPKGGRWIVFEHVRRRDNGGVALYQSVLNWVWPTFFNGCQLVRDTGVCIESLGGWDMKKSGGGLGPIEGDSPWAALPTVAGVLVSV